MLNYLAAFLWSCELFITGVFLNWTYLLTYGTHMLLSKVIMLITLQNVHWKWSKNKRGFFTILSKRWPLVAECKTISSSFMVRSYKYSICLYGFFIHKSISYFIKMGFVQVLLLFGVPKRNMVWKNITLDINAFFCCLLMQQFRLSTFKSNLFVMGT